MIGVNEFRNERELIEAREIALKTKPIIEDAQKKAKKNFIAVVIAFIISSCSYSLFLTLSESSASLFVVLIGFIGLIPGCVYLFLNFKMIVSTIRSVRSIQKSGFHALRKFILNSPFGIIGACARFVVVYFGLFTCPPIPFSIYRHYNESVLANTEDYVKMNEPTEQNNDTNESTGSMFCRHCGKPLAPNTQFCGGCGQRI